MRRAWNQEFPRGGRSVAGAIQARPMLARGSVYASRVRLTIGHIAAIYADASGKDGASRDHGSDSVDMGDPQGPLRRIGLPLTNGHSPGGSWHGGSVPRTDLSRCSKLNTAMNSFDHFVGTGK